jgi:hypothetical protein
MRTWNFIQFSRSDQYYSVYTTHRSI